MEVFFLRERFSVLLNKFHLMHFHLKKEKKEKPKIRAELELLLPCVLKPTVIRFPVLRFAAKKLRATKDTA